MPTVARLAAPQGIARSSLGVRMTSLRWASQELTNVLTAAQLAAPQEDARSRLCVRMTSLRWDSQELTKRADDCAVGSTPGRREVSSECALRWAS